MKHKIKHKKFSPSGHQWPFYYLKVQKTRFNNDLTVAAVSSLLEFSFTENFALLTHFVHLSICIIFRMLFLQKPILISFAQVSVIYFTELLSVKFKCYYFDV